MNQDLIPLQHPDYLFEVSWEVCNKIGGIHTVVATKALTLLNKYGDNYILIGPDFTRVTSNNEFEEDEQLLKTWKHFAYKSGLRVKVGRWKGVVGNPIVILVNFSTFIGFKDKVLKKMWDSFQVDSISGDWDYIEPILFGYASGKVIESLTQHYVEDKKRVLAHYHEWMTASGVLYLRSSVPSVATLFTTHATVLGRSITGNGMPLYNKMQDYNVDELARRFGVVAKHSIEKQAAHYADAFTTVSNITAKECSVLLNKDVSCVTPNGFENGFVPIGKRYDLKRTEARNLLLKVAETALDYKFKEEPLIVSISGRYEYKNKGIDLYLASLSQLNHTDSLDREILAYIMVPGYHNGARRDLRERLDDINCCEEYDVCYSTHYLGDADNDMIVRSVRENGLDNKEGKVKLIFAPCYLNGDDGIFNTTYYDLLIGMDVTVYPSCYEPWGYTPLESLAFGVPTITTSLAGFGQWIEQKSSDNHKGIDVIDRDGVNDEYVISCIVKILIDYSKQSKSNFQQYSSNSKVLSTVALWEHQISYYQIAYDKSLNNASLRQSSEPVINRDGGTESEQLNFVRQQLLSNSQPNWTRLMVERFMPDSLKPLEELTNNLWWSWTSEGAELFRSIDEQSWYRVERNPIALLDTLSHQQMINLEQDKYFRDRLDSVYTDFKHYMSKKSRSTHPRIAYFSMEYGLHSSLKIYSGGLGILAGDYLKESSDKNIPMVGVGLLYRYGYFTQKLSAQGEQEASYEPQNFFKLPISAVRDSKGVWVTVQVAFPGRDVVARIWRCDVGRTELYLLDTDHDLNLEEDRAITHHLYGGNWENRFKQEFLLGVGGVRALNKLGIESDVYHFNEGHGAFVGLERINNLEQTVNLSFSEALEVVRSSALFTTHTPVPAGHDSFEEGLLRQYMAHYAERLKITWEQFMSLGKTNPNDQGEKFSMSILASNLSQEINGVSWLHGEVSKDILQSMWPGYMPCELHIGYVTNGVHFPTWTASSFKDLYRKYCGDSFLQGDYSMSNWNKIYSIPDSELWDVRLGLKRRLIDLIKDRLTNPAQFKFDSPRQLVQIQEELRPEVLTIGFARRFATYKRAHLLFTNLDRLSEIINHSSRPVQFLFAGKAHPADKAGQDLIKRIVEVSKMPQFIGKIIFLQGYDMEIARRMVQGVDIWLNTPIRTLEASGTSGEKAVMNGVMNFSVLDGWWVEGYKEGAGWMLPKDRTFDDARYQDELDAEIIYNTIQEDIAPLYYLREDTKEDYSKGWLSIIKRCIVDVASNFTTNRMMQDYEDRYYTPLYLRHRSLIDDDYFLARGIASWKRKISKNWDKIEVVGHNDYDVGKAPIMMGQDYQLDVTLEIGDLSVEDIGVELVVGELQNNGKMNIVNIEQYEPVKVDGSRVMYRLNSSPDRTGTYDVATRIYPKNSNLPHRMDIALVKWV